MMMLSDAPGSSDAGTQRAKDGGGEGLRRPEHQEHEDIKYLLFIIYHLWSIIFVIYHLYVGKGGGVLNKMNMIITYHHFNKVFIVVNFIDYSEWRQSDRISLSKMSEL